jgi:hypothetical protein
MGLIDRARGIVLQPASEWQVIAAETATPQSLFAGYVVPLAVIGPIAAFIGLTVIGIGVPFIGTIRTSFASGIAHAILSFALALLGVLVLGWVIDAVAPTFGGHKNFVQALKVAAYAYTPAFLAGILLLFPPLAVLQVLAALYGLYLLYLGLPILMQAPPEKALGYTVTVIVCAFLIGIVSAMATAAFRVSPLAFAGSHASTQVSDAQAAAVAAGVLGAVAGGSAEANRNAATIVQGAVDASKQIGSADAGPSPSTEQAVAGAAKAVGALVGGGKTVAVVDYKQLKALLPEAPAGLTRTDASAETKRIGGISGSSATATYENGTSGRLTLEISDMGNMSGLLAIGSLAMNATEGESDRGYEKNVTVNGQRAHEKFTTAGSRSELTMVVGDRFMLQVTGSGVDVASAEQLLGSIDLARLAALTAR